MAVSWSNVKFHLGNFSKRSIRITQTKMFKLIAVVYLLAQLLMFILWISTAKQYDDKQLTIIDNILLNQSILIPNNPKTIISALTKLHSEATNSAIEIFHINYDSADRISTTPTSSYDFEWTKGLTDNAVGTIKLKPNTGDYTELRYLAKDTEGNNKLLFTYQLSDFDGLFSIISNAWIISRIIFLFTTIGLIGYVISLRLKQLDLIVGAIDAFEGGEYTCRIPKIKKETDIAKLAQRLNEVLDHTEYLMKNTRQITNNIAHDLRKPLTRIRNRLELLLIESVDPNHIEELEKSINDADNLLQTFNALLSISQAETGAHRDSFEKIYLTEICTDMVDLYSAVAEDKNITITLNIEEPLPIKGSKQLITQLVSNLLDNACKYIHENGNITVTGKRLGDHIKVAIIDDGPGIPSGYHHKVLERFTRLDSARTAEGNGLGLSLAKAVISLHNAKMEFKNSDPGLIVELTFIADKEQHFEVRRNTRQL
jgi:signal transduction histidine kinase